MVINKINRISSPDKGRLGGVYKINKDFCYIPYNPELVEVARKNRKNPTEAEEKFWYKVLRKKQFENYRFVRQKPLDNFIADFYCAELMMAIEIDGDSHCRQEEYDILRTEELDNYGIQVVRYTNNEIMFNIDNVHKDLKNKIEKLSSLDKGRLGGV